MENNEDIKEDLKEVLDKSKKLFNKSKKVLKNKLDESRNAFADYLDAGDKNNVLKISFSLIKKLLFFIFK